MVLRRRPEDEAICLFAGLLANPDVPLSLWILKPPDVRARATKMCGVARTRSEAVLLHGHAFHATVH